VTVTQGVEAGTAGRRLEQRLLAVAPVLLTREEVPDSDLGASELIDQLVCAVREDPRPERLWLLFVGVASRYPTSDELLEARRVFELAGNTDASLWLLDCALIGASGGSAPDRGLSLVCNSVLVEVDHSAQHDLHTGIQQVVRQLLPRWVRDHDVVPVAWTARSGAHRGLGPLELDRVLSWEESRSVDAVAADTDDELMLVPWQSLIVMAEVPARDAASRLATLAQYSGNQLVAIGYDCIPVVSADLVPAADANRFVHYLTVIKHAQRVAAISASAVAEFQGFVETLPTQGLRGPVVIECMLPTTPDTNGQPSQGDVQVRKSVLAVGSFEPRKNHLAIVHAAEKLWRSGLEFELTFIGGSGWGSELPERIAQLQDLGRPITVLHQADAATLDRAYRVAAFSIFTSLHEGYGLPVAESLAAGTPVITSDFGSMLEIAGDGGAVAIDPYDDASLTEAMRTLLTDDTALAELETQIATRPRRDWADYARELWAVLVDPLVASGVESERP
jgi:glycosyltransferase involved in cell wall biosynthesis